jgi:hypothetical protein
LTEYKFKRRYYIKRLKKRTQKLDDKIRYKEYEIKQIEVKVEQQKIREEQISDEIKQKNARLKQLEDSLKYLNDSSIQKEKTIQQMEDKLTKITKQNFDFLLMEISQFDFPGDMLCSIIKIINQQEFANKNELVDYTQAMAYRVFSLGESSINNLCDLYTMLENAVYETKRLFSKLPSKKDKKLPIVQNTELPLKTDANQYIFFFFNFSLCFMTKNLFVLFIDYFRLMKYRVIEDEQIFNMTKNKFDCLIEIMKREDISEDALCHYLGKIISHSFKNKADIMIYIQARAYRYFILKQNNEICVLINQLEDTICITKKLNVRLFEQFSDLMNQYRGNYNKLHNVFICRSTSTISDADLSFVKYFSLDIFLLMLNCK